MNKIIIIMIIEQDENKVCQELSNFNSLASYSIYWIIMSFGKQMKTKNSLAKDKTRAAIEQLFLSGC